MEIVPVKVTLEDLPGFTATKRAADAASRAPGIHLSHVIRYIMVRGYGKKYEQGPPNVGAATRMDLGFLWEDIFTRGLRDRLADSRPGVRGVEITHDGIAMNPDLIVTDATPPRIEEFKYTKRSLKKFISAPDVHFPDWILQVQGYLKGIQNEMATKSWGNTTALWGHEHHACIARLVPVFVNGDYSWKPPHGDTTMYPVDIRFEPWELDEAWAQILTNKAAMEQEIKEGTYVT